MVDKLIETETYNLVFIILALVIIVFVIWKHRDELSEPQKQGLGFLVLIIVIIGLSMWGSINDYSFGKNNIVSTGLVYDVVFVSPYKGATGTKLYYKYKVNGNIYNGVSDTKSGSSNRYKNLNNKTLQLLYNPSTPQESYLLVTSTDYAKFALTIPDSMKWVIGY